MSGEVWAIQSQQSRGYRKFTYKVFVEPAMLNELEDKIDKACGCEGGDQCEIGHTEHDS
jgi:hypothetical protein